MPVPTGIRRAKLPALLASTSVAALLMGGSAPALAACSNYINVTAAGCTNTGTITPSLIVSNSTVNGSIVNGAGSSISPNGIIVENNSLLSGGDILTLGTSTITGGLSIDQLSRITNIPGGPAVAIDIGGQSFSGNLSNAGVITEDIGPGAVNTGILVEGASFTGNIINTGSINLGTNNASVGGVGIQVDNAGGLATFAGGVSNGGSIAVRATSSNNCASYGIAVLGNINSPNLGLFTGGITNGGSIAVSTTGAFGTNSSNGIFVTNVTTFMGGIANTGSIAATIGGAGPQSAAGISVNNVATFTGGITNGPNASITAKVGSGSNAAGIVVNNVTSFQGGISNAGSITANTGILVTGSGPVSVFDSGTIVGTSGTAVNLAGNAAGNTFTLGPGFAITGKVLGQGNDTFQLGGSGTGSFDLSTIGATQQYQGFTSFNVVSGTWISSNIFGQSQAWNVNGGTLAGTGTFNTLNVNNGGTLMPGTPGVAGGKITVNGNLTFAGGSNYVVDLSPTTTSTTAVSGKANLAGTMTLIFTAGHYLAGTVYDVLSAGAGLNGVFSTVDVSGNLGNLKAVVSYDDVFVTLVPTLLVLPPGAPVNPTNVGNAVNNANASTNGNLPSGLANLFNLSPTQLVPALTQLDGEVATGAELGAFLLTDQFLELMLDPFVDGRSGSGWPFGGGGGALGFASEKPASVPGDVTRAYAMALKAPPAALTFDQRWSVWGATFGGSASANGDPVVIGSTNITAREFAFAGGFDYKLTPNSVIGFALAGGGTNWGLGQALGSGRSDVFEGGIYGVTRWGNAYVGADAAFGNHWMSTQRFALGDELTANFNGQTSGVRAETGYRYAVLPTVGVTPYAALQSQWFHTPNYSETDLTNPANGFALAYGAMTANDTRSELGARLDDRMTLGSMPLVLRGRLAWAHDWVTNPAMFAAFALVPGSNFTVYGAPLPHDSALTSLAAELHIAPRWTMTGKFWGNFASGYQAYAGTGTLRYTW